MSETSWNGFILVSSDAGSFLINTCSRIQDGPASIYLGIGNQPQLLLGDCLDDVEADIGLRFFTGAREVRDPDQSGRLRGPL